MKIIANAEVDRILIEKTAGGRPVAVGATYKDKEGRMHEVRAARVVLATGTMFATEMLYRSGYGPKDLLGDSVIVENRNVGANLTGDVNLVSAAYMSEPVTPLGGIDQSAEPWVAVQPRPWPELSVHIRARTAGRYPVGNALDTFAPAFAWEHKEVIPRTFFWSCGPASVMAAYGWRRMAANHFSRGSSTKGFA